MLIVSFVNYGYQGLFWIIWYNIFCHLVVDPVESSQLYLGV
jgi:hypothetical protein